VNAFTATHKYVVDGPRPIRHLAPEALRKGRYSEKSVSEASRTRAPHTPALTVRLAWPQDVWSFGVTGWELLTNGDTPYYATLDDDAVVTHVTSGEVLSAPKTPGVRQIWDAVAPCFALLPKDRPTFAQLGVALGAVPPPHHPVPGGGAAAGRGPPEILICPITKTVMKEPVSLPIPFDSGEVDICFEATAVSGFVVRGVNPTTETKGWARYRKNDTNVELGRKAVGDVMSMVQHAGMSVACEVSAGARRAAHPHF
jgi:serine/threonine protein kinase